MVFYHKAEKKQLLSQFKKKTLPIQNFKIQILLMFYSMTCSYNVRVLFGSGTLPPTYVQCFQSYFIVVNIRVFPTSICINFQWVVIFCFIMLCLVMLRICDLNSLALDINNVASKQEWGCVVSSYMENTPGSRPVGCMPSLKKGKGMLCQIKCGSICCGDPWVM